MALVQWYTDFVGFFPKNRTLQEKTVGHISDLHHQARKVLHMAPRDSVNCLSTPRISIETLTLIQ